MSEQFSGNLPRGHLPHLRGSSSTGFLARVHFSAGTCVFLESGTGTENLLFARSGIAGEHFGKIGEKMQGYARGPFGVTPEAGDADERQAWFHSMGKSRVEYSVRAVVPFQDVVQPPWRPAPVRARGNAGRRLHCRDTLFPGRANPAATRRGGSA